jgi:ATPase subunit of ABC transporter with duplicated ATPase domains
VDRIVSFEPEGVRSYVGDYDDYLSQRALEEEILEARAKNQERELRDLQRFVDKFRAKATKARQAQSRAKQIKKMEKELVKPIVRPKRLSFTFPAVARTGRDVLRLDKISKRFGELQLYHGMSLQVAAGERVAILGVNGAGKTTLLRIMAGELPPDEGQVVLGANVDRGYYAQHHTDVLDPKRTVLEEVWRALPTSSQTFVRSVCGAFLFPGDDVDKPVGVLSGGERARVLLARLLVKPGNLLLLDEPTNHLDLAAAEALVDALEGFSGTLVFVSHNESFVNRLATRVWDVADGGVTEYPGNLDTYLEHLARREAEQAAEQARKAEAAARASAGTPPGKQAVGGANGAAAQPEPSLEGRGGPTDSAQASAKRREQVPTSPQPSAKRREQVPTSPQPSGKRREQVPTSPQASAKRREQVATSPQPSAKRREQVPTSPQPSAKRREQVEATEQARASTAAQPTPPQPEQPDPEREKLRERISALRATEADLSKSLADPDVYRDAARFDALLAEHRKAQQKVVELEARLAGETPRSKKRRRR